MRKFALLAVPIVALAALLPAAVSHASTTPEFHLAWQSDFGTTMKVGQVTGCSGTTYICSGEPAAYKTQIGAYPAGWPDTATEEHLSRGGTYEPQLDVRAAGGILYIRSQANATSNQEAVVVPLASRDVEYGEFSETFRVVNQVTGFKNAHMLIGDAPGYDEIDYPEGDYLNETYYAYMHLYNAAGTSLNQQSFNSGVTPADWETYTIKWTPGQVQFLVNGNVVGTSTKGIPAQRGLTWIIQNESALDGQLAKPGTWSVMQIKSMSYYKYEG